MTERAPVNVCAPRACGLGMSHCEAMTLTRVRVTYRRGIEAGIPTKVQWPEEYTSLCINTIEKSVFSSMEEPSTGEPSHIPFREIDGWICFMISDLPISIRPEGSKFTLANQPPTYRLP